MQSCLEIYSMDGTSTLPYGRHQQEIRSDYQRTNQYSETHDDAMANGQGRQHTYTTEFGTTAYTMGRSTGNGPHVDWLPNCKSQMGTFVAGFDTDINSNAGNEMDKDARNWSLTRSLYTPTNMYDETTVDTTANVNEGQFSLT